MRPGCFSILQFSAQFQKLSEAFNIEFIWTSKVFTASVELRGLGRYRWLVIVCRPRAKETGRSRHGTDTAELPVQGRVGSWLSPEGQCWRQSPELSRHAIPAFSRRHVSLCFLKITHLWRRAWISQPAVLRVYSCLFAQGSLLWGIDDWNWVSHTQSQYPPHWTSLQP